MAHGNVQIISPEYAFASGFHPEAILRLCNLPHLLAIFSDASTRGQQGGMHHVKMPLHQ